MVANASLGEMQFFLHSVSQFCPEWKKIFCRFQSKCSPGDGIFPFDTKQKMKTALSLGRSTQRESPLRSSELKGHELDRLRSHPGVATS